MRQLIAFMMAIMFAVGALAAEPVKSSLKPAELEALGEAAAQAELVCVGEAVKVRDTGTAEVKVVSVLKGKAPAQTIEVRFTKIFGGVWPEKGVTAIYFLKVAGNRPAKGPVVYDLTSNVSGMAAPTEDRLAVVRQAIEGKPVVKVERLVVPAPESLEGMCLDSTYVAIGTIQEVALPDAKTTALDVSALIAFRIEKSFKGDLEPGLIFVALPTAHPELVPAELRPLAPRVGASALFFRRDGQGGGYRLLSPYRGFIGSTVGVKELGDRVALAIDNEKALRKAGLVGNLGGHDSVRDTIKSWMNAWNTKTEIEAVIACYSRTSACRRKWESSPEARIELTTMLAKYPGSINVVCDQVEETGKDKARATVRIQVLTKDRDPDRQVDNMEVHVKYMTFVHEAGQWLIVDDGNESQVTAAKN